MFRSLNVLGSLLWAGVIAFAGAGTALAGSPPPVTIDACRIAAAHSFVSAYKPIAVSFTVHGPAAVRRIRFAVDYAGRMERVTDAGTFSQSVEVEHTFDGFYNQPYLAAPPRCSVEYVEYVNGTAWHPNG